MKLHLTVKELESILAGHLSKSMDIDRKSIIEFNWMDTQGVEIQVNTQEKKRGLSIFDDEEPS